MSTRKDFYLESGDIMFVKLVAENTRAMITLEEQGNAAEVWLTYEELRQLIDALETLKGNLES
jgi:hypothetical protein